MCHALYMCCDRERQLSVRARQLSEIESSYLIWWGLHSPSLSAFAIILPGRHSKTGFNLMERHEA